MNDELAVAGIAAAHELAPVPLTEREFRDLLAFLDALTDPSSIDLRSDVPAALSSGNTLAE